MRKIREPRLHITFYMPEDLYNRLEQYALKYVGRTYGKNEIIIQALDEFLKRKERGPVGGISL